MAPGSPVVVGAEAMGRYSCGMHTGRRLHTIASAPGSVLALDWSPCGNLLVGGDSDGRLRWWDVQSGDCVRMREAHQGAIQSLRISPDGCQLASCGDDGAVKVWDLERGELLHTLRRDRPYERLNITEVKGLTEAQKATLRAVGAIEEVTLPLWV
jgi:WD40 repeat protein